MCQESASRSLEDIDRDIAAKVAHLNNLESTHAGLIHKRYTVGRSLNDNVADYALEIEIRAEGRKLLFFQNERRTHESSVLTKQIELMSNGLKSSADESVISAKQSRSLSFIAIGTAIVAVMFSFADWYGDKEWQTEQIGILTLGVEQQATHNAEVLKRLDESNQSFVPIPGLLREIKLDLNTNAESIIKYATEIEINTSVTNRTEQ